MTEAVSYDSLAAVRAMAEDLTETVSMARVLAASGRAVDLAGLDQQIVSTASPFQSPFVRGGRF